MSDPIAPPDGDGPIVNSLLHPRAQEIRALLDPAQRPTLDTLLIDDDENIVQALQAGIALRYLFHSPDRPLSPALEAALPPEVPRYEVATRTGKKLFQNEKLSRTFAIAERPAPRPLSDLAAGSGDLIALEDIAIMGNSGAIIRSALALGAGGLVLLGAEPHDLYDRRLIRASRGYLFTLPVVAASVTDFLDFCRAQGLELVLTEASATETLDTVAALPQRLAFVFGSEKEGASTTVAEAATRHVRIPIAEGVESLNVSVAAAITLYARRARLRAD